MKVAAQMRQISATPRNSFPRGGFAHADKSPMAPANKEEAVPSHE